MNPVKKPGVPKPPVPPDIIKAMRKQSKDKKPKENKPLVELRNGLAIQVINPENEEGFLWHSRLSPQGIIQVNAMNTDFTEAERRGQTILFRYILLLLQKELTCASLAPMDNKIFNQSFEKTFLNFWKSSLLE